MPRDEAGILSEIKRDFILRRLKEGKRGDGRKPDEYREISITPNYVPRSPGSAMVCLGKTKVVAGIKVEAGEPFPDTPNQGVLTTNVELLPMAFPTFEAGPPNDTSIEIARVVDRGIRESKMIDIESLVIEPAKKVWIVFVDIDVIDFDGNLIDACTLGAKSAGCTYLYGSLGHLYHLKYFSLIALPRLLDILIAFLISSKVNSPTSPFCIALI